MTMIDRARAWMRGLTTTAVVRPPVDPGLLAWDLPLRRDAATDRTQAASGALREDMLAAGGLMLDADDHQWRRITSGQRFSTRDLTPIQHDRMLQIAWYLIEANPFAKRLLQLMTDLIVGEGWSVSAKDARVSEILTTTWNHPSGKLGANLRQFYFANALNGELILPVARNPITGIPHLGYIDPMQVLRVERRADNVLVPETVVLRAANGQTDGQRLKVVAEDPLTGRLDGEVFYHGINGLPNGTRGRSDLLPLADWLDLYDSLMFSEVERTKILSSFVWDLSMTGASQPEIQKRVRELKNPTPGTVYGHNEKETLEARTPALDASDRSEVTRMLAIHISGSIGFPISWLGFSDSNRATIDGQNDVMMKTPAARQKEFSGFLNQIMRFAVEGATTKNRALYRDVQDVSWEINVPEIAAKDVARVGAVIGSVVQAMDTAQANKTMSRRAAAVATLTVMRHLGIDLDVDEVLAEADQDHADQQAGADERAALLARATAALAATRATAPAV